MPDLATAQVVGLILESLLFGIYLAVFAGSCYIIFSHDSSRQCPRGSINKVMVVACFILFASITSHWAIDIARFFEAFVNNHGRSPSEYYSVLAEGKNVAKTALYTVECFTADAIMILRLHYVWNRSHTVCILPVLTTLAFAVTGSGVTYQFAIAKPGVEVFVSECGRWILSSFALTLVTNIYSTSLIAYKLWSTSRPLHGLSIDKPCLLRHMRVLVVVAESAFLYSACTLTTFITYLCRSNTQYPSLDTTSPVIGIVFCLIIVRVRILGQHNFRKSVDVSTLQMHSLSVTISTHVYRDNVSSSPRSVTMKEADEESVSL